MNASLVMDIPVMFAVMLLLTLPALIKAADSRRRHCSCCASYAASVRRAFSHSVSD